MIQLRAQRDAVEQGKLLIYIQAIDRTTPYNLDRVHHMRMIDLPNYNTCGNVAGLLPLFVGTRVRLTTKLSQEPKRLPLVPEASGTVVGIRFHDCEDAGAWTDDPNHSAWQKGYVLLKRMPDAVLVRFDCLAGTDPYGFGDGIVAVKPTWGTKSFKYQ